MALLTGRPRLYWTLQVVGWGLFGLLGCLMGAAFGQVTNLGLLVLAETITAVNLIVFSHLLRQLIRRWHWLQLPLGALLPRLLAAIVLDALVSIAAIGLCMVLVHWLLYPEKMGSGFPWRQYGGYFLNVFVFYWLWALLYFGLHYFDRYRLAEIDRWKLAATAREAEMRTLQAQLNPHFLFNGLNNIRALVMEDPARARAMMTHLAELLRYAMQRNSAERLPLAAELDIVENYLQLEALQLENRLRYTLDAAPDALAVPLPPMTLQLLVENAIKHGLAPRPAGGSIALSAWLEAGSAGPLLRVAVRNTGRYAPPPGHPGVGVRNVQERLRLLYGPAASLSIGPDPQQPDTVLAELTLPAPVATTAAAPAAAPVAATPTSFPHLPDYERAAY